MDGTYWKSLVDRYFEGLTTEREEEALKLFLASDASSDPCFEEARAVMGMFAAARMRRRRLVRLRIIGWASAAAAVILVSFGVMRNAGSCVMWENGERITDREVILASAEESLTDIFSGGADAEEELKNLFEIR